MIKIMYSKTIILILLFSSLTAISQIKNEPFATWSKDHYEITTDTNRIKQQTEELFRRMGYPLQIGSIEVKEGAMVSEKKTAYFFVLMSDLEQSTKVVKYLKKEGNTLMLIHERKDKNDYQIHMIRCTSRESQCEPQLVVKNDEHIWVCKCNDSNDSSCERQIVTP